MFALTFSGIVPLVNVTIQAFLVEAGGNGYWSTAGIIPNVNCCGAAWPSTPLHFENDSILTFNATRFGVFCFENDQVSY
jgi:hypothetical protein